LREKQKLKAIYGVFERQFRNYFAEAERLPGNTGENLLILLERRLDNVVWRAGFALSRAQARQLVRHGHITVNGKKLDIPSYLVKKGDVIRSKEREKSKNLLRDFAAATTSRSLPSWLQVDRERLEARVVNMPTRDEVPFEIKEQLIVEFCSR